VSENNPSPQNPLDASPKARLLFFGDGRWATLSLRRLADEGYKILGVVLRLNSTDPELAELARSLSVPVHQPQKVNSRTFVRQVGELAPDLNISVSYDQIFRHSILDIARLGFINLHAGNLPYYRGRNAINWAIINGEEKIGLTAHFVDEGIDTGNIVLQCSLPIGWTDTYADVLGCIEGAMPDLVCDAVDRIASGRVEHRRQDHLPGTYYAARRKGDEWLDWSNTSRNLYNKIRAITHPGPGACTVLDGQPVVIWSASYDLDWPTYMATPGEVVGYRLGEGVYVKTGDSTLLVTKVQMEEGEVIPHWRIGTRLGLNVSEYLYSLESRLADLERRMAEKG
jgi:methionyl-tRNA formyltransferase